MCVCVCVCGCVLVMDVSLFLFVVSQESSFSHAVNCTHSLSHTGRRALQWEKEVGASRKRGRGRWKSRGSKSHSPWTRWYAKDTLGRATESFKSNSLFPRVLTLNYGLRRRAARRHTVQLMFPSILRPFIRLLSWANTDLPLLSLLTVFNFSW